MGNHEVGRAMGRMAEIVLKLRTNPTTQTALSLLDQICEPYRGADAEFEAVDPHRPGHTHPDYCRYTDPKGPLGILIQEAFDPKVDWIAIQRVIEATCNDDKVDEFYESWGDGPEKQFDARYEFC
jgi:hypothetical protein